MVDWSSPKEIEKDSGEFRLILKSNGSVFELLELDVFLKLIFSLFGVYIWELFTTCDFEYSLLSRRRTFRWPLVRIGALALLVYL